MDDAMNLYETYEAAYDAFVATQSLYAIEAEFHALLNQDYYDNGHDDNTSLNIEQTIEKEHPCLDPSCDTNNPYIDAMTEYNGDAEDMDENPDDTMFAMASQLPPDMEGAATFSQTRIPQLKPQPALPSLEGSIDDYLQSLNDPNKSTPEHYLGTTTFNDSNMPTPLKVNLCLIIIFIIHIHFISLSLGLVA